MCADSSRCAELLDRHVNDGGIDGTDAEGLRRVHLDTKIVSARTETVKVDERVDRAGAQIGQRFAASARRHARKDRAESSRVRPDCRLRQRIGTPASSRSTGAGQDFDRDRRVLGLNQPNRRIGHARR